MRRTRNVSECLYSLCAWLKFITEFDGKGILKSISVQRGYAGKNAVVAPRSTHSRLDGAGFRGGDIV